MSKQHNTNGGWRKPPYYYHNGYKFRHFAPKPKERHPKVFYDDRGVEMIKTPIFIIVNDNTIDYFTR